MSIEKTKDLSKADKLYVRLFKNLKNLIGEIAN